MATHYSKVLSSGQKVEIDDVNVTVDDSRYPTRNISAVHLKRSKKPNVFILALAALLFAFGAFFIVWSIVALIYDAIYFPNSQRAWIQGTGPVFVLAAIFIVIAYILSLFAKSPYHTISFGSSGNDKDLIMMPAILDSGYVNILKAAFKWEEVTQDSYNEIKACSNAISDAIDELQRRGS